MSIRRRPLLRGLVLLTLAAGAAGTWATQPFVEIIAYAHPPVQSSLKPLRDWLATRQGKLRVVEVDMDSPAAAQRLQALGLKGHIPVVVLVKGSYRHQRPDGSDVTFVGFRAGPGTPAGARGSWTAQDVQAAIAAR